MQKEVEKVIVDKDEEIYCLKSHNQSLVAQMKLKNKSKSQKGMLEQLIGKESLINEETMTEPMELEKPSDVKIQVMEK
jgi:hypothetical protein